jgi:nitrate/TMAO reductase-like tetraheme cytochrome c subunit
MKRIMSKIKKFFFPSHDAKLILRVAPYALLGFLTLIVLTSAAYGWEYTNSPEFCGTSCHTMPPEYTAYQVSPHANIACVDCHIGRAFIGIQVFRKAGDLKHVFYTVFKNYEYPITANDMRPARETCEKCHSPQKFSDDSLVQLKQFGNDKDNSPSTTYLVLKTGGGSSRTGGGRGIHWHIIQKIEYYTTDPTEQEIPYVRVYNEDGSYEEYVDIESNIDPTAINENDLKEMDCLTCHNRITHLVPQPENAMDSLLSNGTIDSSIPEIRLKGIQVLRATYASQAQALEGIAALRDYYRVYYPTYYTENQQKIQTAVESIQNVFQQSVYLEQKSDWNSHPNNVGHKYSPGCFRCHDGKHLNPEQEAIRMECNLCHSIPVVTDNQDFTANIEISRGPEPTTHRNSNWISLHRDAINNTCSNCHTTSNPGGTDNSSFCSNSACHGNVWTYAGFDAPALRKILENQLPPTPEVPVLSEGALTYNDSIGPLLTGRCGGCHGAEGIQGLNLTTYSSAMKGSNNGAVILPDDPANSLIIKKQSETQPHFAQLSPEELVLVEDWIQAGAPEK